MGGWARRARAVEGRDTEQETSSVKKGVSGDGGVCASKGWQEIGVTAKSVSGGICSLQAISFEAIRPTNPIGPRKHSLPLL